MKNIPFLSFLRRYWLIHLALVAAAFLALSEGGFLWLGAIAYLPVLVIGALDVALLGRHLFFRQTLDEDAASGWFVKEWHGLDPDLRIGWNLIVVCVLFIGACIVAAALAK